MIGSKVEKTPIYHFSTFGSKKKQVWVEKIRRNNTENDTENNDNDLPSPVEESEGTMDDEEENNDRNVV